MQRINIGLYLVTSIRLTIFGTGHTLATFQAVGKTFLLMQLLIILTIGGVISSTTGFCIENRDRRHPLNNPF